MSRADLRVADAVKAKLEIFGMKMDYRRNSVKGSNIVPHCEMPMGVVHPTAIKLISVCLKPSAIKKIRSASGDTLQIYDPIIQLSDRHFFGESFPRIRSQRLDFL